MPKVTPCVMVARESSVPLPFCPEEAEITNVSLPTGAFTVTMQVVPLAPAVQPAAPGPTLATSLGWTVPVRSMVDGHRNRAG